LSHIQEVETKERQVYQSYDALSLGIVRSCIL